MRSRNVRLIGLVAGAALVAALGSAIAAEGDGDDVEVVVVGADEALVVGLLAVESELPQTVPSQAQVAANQLDPVLLGSFTSARSTFDRLEDDIRQLFIDGDAANTAVGDAVSDVARGLLLERQALLVLEESDGSTEARPLDASDARDDDGVAIDADGELGQAVVGIDLLLDALEVQRSGYQILAALPPASDENDIFDARFETLVEYDQTVGTALRVLASSESEELLVPADRFDAPIGVARAVSATYVCVDRELYMALPDLPQAERVAASLDEEPSAACAEAARRAGLSLEDQQAAEEAGVDGPVSADTDADDGDDADA